MNRLFATLLATAVLGVVSISVGSAQDPRNSQFRCHFFTISGLSQQQLGACPDTIIVVLEDGLNDPLPEKHPNTPYSVPGTLYANSLNAPNTGYTEFPAHWIIDRPARRLYIIPDQRLQARVPPNPTTNPGIVYTLQLECGYWTGDTTQKKDFFFDVKDRLAISTWAMSLEDSTRITPLIEGFDSLLNYRFTIMEGVEISAPLRSGDWVFSHWSMPNYLSQIREFNQPDWRSNVITIQGGCWPSIMWSVPFQAWYRRQPVSAADPSSSVTLPEIRGREHHLEVHANPASAPITLVQVTDVRGAVVVQHPVPQPQPVTYIPCTLSPGVYFVQVWRGTSVVALPYYHHH